jgi:hypothetical protein
MVMAVPNFCSMKSVILAKCTLLTLRSVANLLATSSSFLSTAQKWFSCSAMMSTKWSTCLLLLTICVSTCKIFAKLKGNNVRAAVYMPSTTKSRKRLFLVMTSYCGSVSRMLLKSFSLSARHDLLISPTSSTCVQNGSGHFLMYLWYWLKMSVGVSVSCEKLNGTRMWIKCVDAAYFLEGMNNNCNLLGSTKFESSSFSSGSGTAWAPSILRARMSRKKKMKAAERQVRKQGVAPLAKKLLGRALLRLLFWIFSRISSFVCIFA